ncbi:hypothetical protein IKS57_02990 [bacterium]|nr:hypothetical protein [bacterium]
MNFKEIKTYGDLIDIIRSYNLQDKKIIVGCQGYMSLFDGEFEETKIMFNEDYAIICDNNGSYENEFDYLEEKKRERQEFEFEVNRLYDLYLQKTENRNMSYGEFAYTSSLSDKDLEEFYNELLENDIE